jgi:uncharacterized repeat protein (TIGR03803 family)
MNNLVRYTVTIGAAALFSGCGGAQSPIGAQATMQQNRLHPASLAYSVLYRFDRYPNGELPIAGLTNVGATLYGTASNGGVRRCHQRGGCGTFFSITPKGTEKLLYAFTARTGIAPESRLIDVKGTMYGTAHQGGAGARGSVYSITTSGSAAVLYSFLGAGDGAYPDAGVVNVDGTFYGTTTSGGARNNGGTAYSVTSSGVHTVLHKFKGGAGGYDPEGGLIDIKGTLYGTTSYGGAGCSNSSGCGTFYSMTTSGKVTVLYRFAGGADGWNPGGNLLDVNGTLYGTTAFGGGTGCSSSLGCGTVYSVTTGGKEKVLYRFAGGSDGARPAAGLVDLNGTLYGTTPEGGDDGCGLYGCGTVYSLSDSGAESVLYSFTGGTDGNAPLAPLTLLKGTLYGTTLGGGDPQKGQNCCGTVFALKP